MLVVDHHVVWLDVPVHDPHAVAVVQRLQGQEERQPRMTQEGPENAAGKGTAEPRTKAWRDSGL